MNKTIISPSFPSLVQEFFADYLIQQRLLSPQTVASYRDCFVLLARFAEGTLGKSASALELADLKPGFIVSFLDHLEHDRGNST